MNDKESMDWLQDQIVDVIYLDDGRVIDVGGRFSGDVRKAIESTARGKKVSR